MSVPIQVRNKAQVTLPHPFLDVKVKEGEIVLRVKKLVDKDQAWFWTKRWQEGEREAEKDIREGRTHGFDNAEEAIAFLHNQVNRGSGETSQG